MSERGLWDVLDFLWICDFLDLRDVRGLALTGEWYPIGTLPFERTPMRILKEERLLYDERENEARRWHGVGMEAAAR